MIFLIRIAIVVFAISVSGCSAVAGQSSSNVPDDLIVSDQVGRVGMFAISPSKGTQAFIRREPAELAGTMAALTWLSAFQQPGTVMFWSSKIAGMSFTPTLVVQVEETIPNSNGCNVVDWTALTNVVDQKGLIASADNQRGGGGGFYMMSLYAFAGYKHSTSAGDIVVCRTSDHATVEIYGPHKLSYRPEDTRNPDLYARAGTLTVNVPVVQSGAAAEIKAGSLTAKFAKVPPANSYDGPIPIPTARKQELAGNQ